MALIDQQYKSPLPGMSKPKLPRSSVRQLA
jgi:hypothetical protein